MKLLWLSLLCSMACLSSCRTNSIAQHSLREQAIVYRTTVASDAADAHAHIASPSSNNTAQIFTDIGASITSGELQRKLTAAVQPDSLAMALTVGIQDILHTYFRARSVAGTADNPAYIVEIELQKYQIHSGTGGVYARVTGAAKVFQAGTAHLLWENSESVNVPLQRTAGTGWSSGTAGTAMSIANAADLMRVSEKELRAIMLRAAAEAGRNIGEQLREDATD